MLELATAVLAQCPEKAHLRSMVSLRIRLEMWAPMSLVSMEIRMSGWIGEHSCRASSLTVLMSSGSKYSCDRVVGNKTLFARADPGSIGANSWSTAREPPK